MPLTKEELLQPRYKVVSDYPYSPFEIGNILFPDSKGKELTIGYNTGFTQTIKIVTPSVADNMPHIFKRLDWWEEIKQEDLPMYLKTNILAKQYSFLKVLDWESGACEHAFISHIGTLSGNNYLPATEQEYLDYIKGV